MKGLIKNKVFGESEAKQESFYEVHELCVPKNSLMKVWDDNFELDLGGGSIPICPTVDAPKILGVCAGFGTGGLGVGLAAYCHPWMNGYCINQIPNYTVFDALIFNTPTWDYSSCMEPRFGTKYRVHMLQLRGTIVCPFYSTMPLEFPEVASPQYETVGLEAERILHLSIAQYHHNYADGAYAPLNVFDYMKIGFQGGSPDVAIGMAMQRPETFNEVTVHKHLVFKIDASANVDVNAENVVGVPSAGFYSRGVSNFKVIRIPFEIMVPLEMDCNQDSDQFNTGNYYHEKLNTLWMHAWLEGPLPPNSLYSDANPAGWEEFTPKIYHRARLFYEETNKI